MLCFMTSILQSFHFFLSFIFYVGVLKINKLFIFLNKFNTYLIIHMHINM